MTPFNFVLAYVANAPKSAALYGKLLDAKPVESTANWAMFALPNGLMLGLWGRDEVEPKATLPGGVELGFPVADEGVGYAHPPRLGRARPEDPAGTDQDGLRLHLHRCRPRWPSPEGVRAGCARLIRLPAECHCHSGCPRHLMARTPKGKHNGDAADCATPGHSSTEFPTPGTDGKTYTLQDVSDGTASSSPSSATTVRT